MNRLKPVLCLLVAFGLLGLFVSHQTARSNPDAADARSVRWEYRTEQVEVFSLQAKLTEWSNDHWDVFSIMPADSIVDPGDKPHVRVEKFQVTARRPAK